MRVAFVGIVKDGEAYIQKNIDALRVFGQDIYIVENNSVDDTKNILRAYGKNIKLVTLDLDDKSAADFCMDGVNALCPKRVRRLAYIRQQGLNAVLESGTEYEYVCTVDLDFVSFDRDGLEDMFRFMEEHRDVEGIFGMSKVHRYVAYDIGAVRPYTSLVPIVLQFQKYVPVTSAFSGFGIYRTSAIVDRGAKYDHETITEIEHVHFNSYFKTLIVDTHFNPIYRPDPSTNSINLKICVCVCMILLAVFIFVRT
jgi:glycosyltransferase involved in cell wall biosynthesis